MTDAPAWFRSRRVQMALGVLWIVALYFLCRPYRGVRHDAMLYFGQAQLHLTPDWLHGDLFFLSNSQDNYSAFSTLFAPVLHAFGLSTAEIVVLLGLHALFLFAAWQLTAGLSTTVRWIALALALVLPHFYASEHRFSYAEPFLTARTLAEPFALLAIAASLRGHRVWAVLALVVAALSHPLIALPAWLVVWRLWGDKDERWNWGALVVVPLLALAALGIGPLGGLLHRYDLDWWLGVQRTSPFIFIANWDLVAFQQLAFDIGLLWLCGRDTITPLGRLARASSAVAIGCLIVTMLGVDLAHNVLITQLQLWRASWIAHLVAQLSMGPLLVRLWDRNDKGRLAVFLVLLAAIAIGATVKTGWIIGVAALVSVRFSESRHVVGRGLMRIGIAACVLGMVAVSGVQVASYHDQVHMGAASGLLVGRDSAIPVALTALMLALALVGLWPLARPSARSAAIGAATGVAVLALGVWQWDQRTDWARFVEQHQGQPHPFQAAIPARAQVYWPDDLLASWALLGRSSFYTQAQAAAAPFSRETSIATTARVKAVTPLLVQTDVCRSLIEMGLSDTTASECKPSDVAVIDVCHLTAHGPDFIVLDSPLQAPPVARWHYQPSDSSPPTDYLLYDCNKIH
ncbi:MAG: hypothetical protein ABJD97_01490 [Betaproteobacteria bacterium]